MESGAISSKMVEDSFISATSEGGLYNNMLIKLAETPYGKLQQLMGQFENLKIKVGEALMPIATSFIDIATFLINHIEIVGAVISAWTAYSVATKLMAFYQTILNNTMKANVIYLIISLIVGLIVWITALCQKYEGWGKSLEALWEVIKAFGRLAWLPFKIFGESAWFYVQKLWLQIQDFAQSIVGTFEKVGKAWDLAKGGDFSGAKAALTADVQTQASKDIAALEQGHAATMAAYGQQQLNDVKTIADNVAKIGLKKKGEGGGAVSAVDITSGGQPPIKPTKDKDIASGITGGGPRVINIQIGKMVEAIHISAGSLNEGMDKMESKVKEVFLRVLNSGAAVQ